MLSFALMHINYSFIKIPIVRHLALFTQVLRVIGHAVLVTCAKIDHDGTLYLFDAQGKGIPREEFRESLKLLSPEEVLEGQLVCVRGQRGVVGCVVTPIPEPRSDRHQDLYELRVLNRTSDGQIVEGAFCEHKVNCEMHLLFITKADAEGRHSYSNQQSTQRMCSNDILISC